MVDAAPLMCSTTNPPPTSVVVSSSPSQHQQQQHQQQQQQQQQQLNNDTSPGAYQEWHEEEIDTKWTRETRLMLIREVRMRPRLWSSQYNNHRDPIAIAALRRDIARVMTSKFDIPFTGDDIARQWKYIKDQHRRYIRKRQRYESDESLKGHKIPAFQYAKIMRFVLEDTPFYGSCASSDIQSSSSLLDPQHATHSVALLGACSANGAGGGGLASNGGGGGGAHGDESKTGATVLSSTMAAIHDAAFAVFEQSQQQQQQQDNSQSSSIENGANEWRNSSATMITTDHLNGYRATLNDTCCFQQTSSQLTGGDEHEQFGRTVAAALRRASAQDPAIAQRFRIGVTKMLVELEEEVMMALTNKQQSAQLTQ